MDPADIVYESLRDPLGYLVLVYLFGVALAGVGAILMGPVRRLRSTFMQP